MEDDLKIHLEWSSSQRCSLGGMSVSGVCGKPTRRPEPGALRQGVKGTEESAREPKVEGTHLASASEATSTK